VTSYHPSRFTSKSRFLQAFRAMPHPMPHVSVSVGALSAFLRTTPRHFRPCAAHNSPRSQGLEAPDARRYGLQILDRPRSCSQERARLRLELLRMCYAVPWRGVTRSIRCWLWKAMTALFILHSYHEAERLDSPVMRSGSSGANPCACIAAGCACLWGPRPWLAQRSRAQSRCWRRSESVPAGIPAYFSAQDKNYDPSALMGLLGHPGLKNYDPPRSR